MPANRYYKTGIFKLHETFLLDDAEGHHCAVAMRTQVGEVVEVVNGKGTLVTAVVEEVDRRKGVKLKVCSVYQEPSPELRLVLYQAWPRVNRLDIIVEKITELGVTEVVLFPGERSERSGSLKRLEKVMIAALKQSGRLFLPILREAAPIKKWENLELPLFFGDLGKLGDLERQPQPFPVGKGVKESTALLIGPESGLSSKEVTYLCELGATGVSLNSNVLRTDTAAIAGIALLMVP